MFRRVILHIYLKKVPLRLLDTIIYSSSYLVKVIKTTLHQSRIFYNVKNAVDLSQIQRWDLCSHEHSRLSCPPELMPLTHARSGARKVCSHSPLHAHTYQALHIFTMEVISFSSLLLPLIFFHKYLAKVSGKEFVIECRLLFFLGSQAFSPAQTCPLTFY